LKTRRLFIIVSPVVVAACGTTQSTPSPPTPTTRPAAVTRPVPTDDPIGFASVAPGTTGGRGGQVVTASSSDELRRYLITRDPMVVQVSGALALSGMTPVGSNKTILGIGSDAKIANGGFNLSNVNNVIIRNLTFEGSPDDAINIQDSSHHVWIDHNVLTKANDGLLDIKRGASYVTVSWNVFREHTKTSLVGHDDSFTSDRGALKVTYHHNWFRSDQRNPRVRFGEVHVFNNYYDAVRSYGVASTQDAKVVVEGNVFKNVRQPALVGYEESGPGDLVERGNAYDGSGTPQSRGEAFDPTAYYAYPLTPLSEVSGLVQAAAGVGKI
jgi:pectate lyase